MDGDNTELVPERQRIVGRRAWTEEELDYLKVNWQRPDEELCAELGRNIGTIRSKRTELGLIGKKGRRKAGWKPEELEYLQEVWGQKTIPQIARKLGRSVNAVKVKSYRMGLGGQKWYGEMMSGRKVSELLGVDVHTVCDLWIGKCGLKGARKRLGNSQKTTTIILFEDLLEWLKEHQDLWDSRRVEPYALGMEYDWLKEKRAADAMLPERKKQKWTREEDARLVAMFRKGNMTYAQMGDELGRPASGVEHRLKRIDVWGTGESIEARAKRRRAEAERFERMALMVRLQRAMQTRLNSLGYEPYWQKGLCAHWDDVKGCGAGQTDCDSCTEFARIRPQYCARCGGTFFERAENRFCPPCRAARKKTAQRHWARRNKAR